MPKMGQKTSRNNERLHLSEIARGLKQWAVKKGEIQEDLP